MLIRRNLRLFFRDRANVLFSLLAVFIILALYALFLGSLMEDALRAAAGMESDQIRPLTASIILGGMIAVTSLTSCLGAMETKVADRNGAGRDFLTSPISRGKLTRSYMLGSAAVGLLMTLLILVITVAYIVAIGGNLPSAADWGRLALTLVFSVLCGNAMVFLFTVFLKSPGAFAAMSAVIGSLSGFVMGIYIPIGTLPEAVQWVIRLFPMSHAAGMFRQILAAPSLEALFEGAPPEVVADFEAFYGIVFHYGDFTSGFWFSAAVLVVTTLIFYGLSVAMVRRRQD